ncbi:DoxX family membrane protein [Ensifer adhaerens]|uniref:DoxX family protein n=1 Tax=Ensifer adhaerens TaxID=106592 RepID=UPI001CC16EEB|nr:DoxX family protein [Ensifer adhaerens]MBZ7921469.1 DoxX family membrane protein [Ensifer adhaerens]UAX93894.1 DoxX family membrane protein [Ensifer adhaerens]UAY01529.1 DoxX family membrane protein [Ensifer adhaerens]UAY08912.1 DoxX family membrane protein [Ensifer adhaerens]
MENFVIIALSHPHFAIAAKVVLTSLFWIAGLFGVFKFNAVVQEVVEVNLPFPRLFAAATIACQLIGSALLITNFAGLGWLGAAALAGFTLLTIPYGHAFWRFEGRKKVSELQIALEHITVVGGLAVAASLSVIS